MPAKAIEREYGVKHGQVAQWVERFNIGGIDSLRRRQKRTCTTELMLEVGPGLFGRWYIVSPVSSTI